MSIILAGLYPSQDAGFLKPTQLAQGDISRISRGHLQDIPGTSPGYPGDISRISRGHLQDIPGTSPGYPGDISRISRGHLQGIPWTSSGYPVCPVVYLMDILYLARDILWTSTGLLNVRVFSDIPAGYPWAILTCPITAH